MVARIREHSELEVSRFPIGAETNLLEAALPVLLDPKTRGTTTISLPEGPADFPCYWVGGHAVWGLTYRILSEFSGLAGGL